MRMVSGFGHLGWYDGPDRSAAPKLEQVNNMQKAVRNPGRFFTWQERPAQSQRLYAALMTMLDHALHVSMVSVQCKRSALKVCML